MTDLTKAIALIRQTEPPFNSRDFPGWPARVSLTIAAILQAVAEGRLVEAPTWPTGFFRLGGDARLRECATEGCYQCVSIRMERDGIGSDYCEPCARKIADSVTPEATP